MDFTHALISGAPVAGEETLLQIIPTFVSSNDKVGKSQVHSNVSNSIKTQT